MISQVLEGKRLHVTGGYHKKLSARLREHLREEKCEIETAGSVTGQRDSISGMRCQRASVAPDRILRCWTIVTIASLAQSILD